MVKYKQRVSSDNYFVNCSLKRSSHEVKLRLFKENLKQKSCEKCGNSKWLNSPIPLELHHIDGNRFNNELNNLQILCPNCHYFTDTYKSKNVKNRTQN